MYSSFKIHTFNNSLQKNVYGAVICSLQKKRKAQMKAKSKSDLPAKKPSPKLMESFEKAVAQVSVHVP